MSPWIQRAASACACLALTFAIASCGADEPAEEAEQSGGASKAGEAMTVTLAADPLVLHEAFVNHMRATCPQTHNLTVDVLTGGPRYLDRAVLLSKKNVEFAASGYAIMPEVTAQDLPLVTIAGTNLGALDLVVRNGVEVAGWEDLRGKKVGVPTNSLADHALRVGLQENGIDVDEVEIVSLVPSAAALIALKRGDVDAMTAWEPWSTKAIAQEIGTIPFNYLTSEIGPLNGVLQVHEDTLAERPEVAERMVACMIDSMRALQASPEENIKHIVEWTRLPEAEAEIAAEHFSYDWRIYLKSAAKYAQILHEYGVMKTDESAALLELEGIDYSVLEKVTGETADELGRDLFAPTTR
jgi:ABC-type nitrate/sulfonate/bicarbonate transport system substrate-binding protein